MASIFFATRGIYAAIEQLKMDLMAQRYWWRRKNLKTDKVEDVPIQGGLRPVQVWEYFFPKESPVKPGDLNSEMTDNLNSILHGMGLTGKDHYEPQYIKKYVKFLGKILNLKSIPDTTEPKVVPRFFHQLGISIIPIGWKDDEFKAHDFGPAGKYEQEMI